MSETCSFPLCTRKTETNGFCFLHKIYSGVKEENKDKKPIPKRSQKMKGQMKEYKPIAKKFLQAHPMCEIKSPNCEGKASCIHHMKRRGSNLLNEKYFRASCGPCNVYVENNVAWALEHGHLIPVHQIEKE